MFTNHFALCGEPFSLSPDPAFLYLSPDHEEALSALRIAVQSGRGLTTMIGEVGTGKTTLLNALLASLGPHVRVAYLSNTRLSFADLLHEALRRFGVEPSSRRRADLLQELRTFLEARPAGAEPTALVIDEAQNLAPRAFEDLRLLTNIETPTAKLLQIVLVGQPELAEILGRRSLRHVAERVAFHCRIRPLAWRERRNYVRHRLACVGGSPEIFTPAALWLMIACSRGIPRRINVLGHTAMLFAYGRGQRQVTVDCVTSALRERHQRGISPRRIAASSGDALRAIGGIGKLGIAGATGLIDKVGRVATTGTTDRLRNIGNLGKLGRIAAAVLLVFALGAAFWWHAPAEQPAVGDTEAVPPEQVAATGRTADQAPRPDTGASAADAPVDQRDAAAPSVQPPSAPAEPMGERAAIEERVDRVRESIRGSSAPRAVNSIAPLPPPPPKSRPGRANASVMVQVRPGMTLSDIAVRYYGSASPQAMAKIRAANPSVRGNRLLAGDTIRVPNPNVDPTTGTARR